MSLKEAVGKRGYFSSNKCRFSVIFYADFFVQEFFVYIVLGIIEEVIKPLHEPKKWKVRSLYSFRCKACL